jgi:hypothetical protein
MYCRLPRASREKCTPPSAVSPFCSIHASDSARVANARTRSGGMGGSLYSRTRSTRAFFWGGGGAVGRCDASCERCGHVCVFAPISLLLHRHQTALPQPLWTPPQKKPNLHHRSKPAAHLDVGVPSWCVDKVHARAPRPDKQVLVARRHRPHVDHRRVRRVLDAVLRAVVGLEREVDDEGEEEEEERREEADRGRAAAAPGDEDCVGCVWGWGSLCVCMRCVRCV